MVSTNKENNSKKSTKKVGVRGAEWTFPKNSLEDAIKIPKAIEEQNGGNPWDAEQLAKAIGFNLASDWRFTDLLRSANQYGLVEGTGARATVSIGQIGNDVITPGSATERQTALFRAFQNVELFKKVYEFYKGKKLPEDEFFENTLVRQFSIPRDRVATFKEIFTKNINYLKAFKATEDLGQISQDEIKRPKAIGIEQVSATGREFLDTCFVMMPFGEWQDYYYKEIFSPAIKDAGMEPIRADELFSTGSVIEQIWEQIQKSKILLADLTGKNANVFYELGLAHAAQKPVVFTAANIDDIPFDLRHLRIVTYDFNNPFWGEQLKKDLTEYLKNAMSDPKKSIPQPFREQANLD